MRDHAQYSGHHGFDPRTGSDVAMNWFLFWLVLHITAAVIAFGPIFVFPIVAALVRRRPTHLPFAMELDHIIGSRLVLPMALTMPVSGIGLLVSAHINFFKSTYLVVAIILYIIAMGLATGVQLPGGRRLVELTSGPVPASGPTPETVGLIARARNVGIILTLLILVIIFLMIVQPGGLVTSPG
jgi:hypothetical protein